MYYDLKSGKQTEIDALNGAILKLGKEKKILCPFNEVLTNLVKTKEILSQVA
jgi:2-dehydropantoate 2-reductase